MPYANDVNQTNLGDVVRDTTMIFVANLNQSLFLAHVRPAAGPGTLQVNGFLHSNL